MSEKSEARRESLITTMDHKERDKSMEDIGQVQDKEKNGKRRTKEEKRDKW